MFFSRFIFRPLILRLVVLASFAFVHFSPSVVFGAVHQINTLDKFAEELEKCDSETLVIFDIDDVLLQRKDAILQRANYTYLDAQFDELSKQLDSEKKKKLTSHFDCKAAFEPVDPRMAECIKKLQNRSIPAIGLTARKTGAWGLIPSMEGLIAHKLATYDIRFSAFAPFDGYNGPQKLDHCLS